MGADFFFLSFLHLNEKGTMVKLIEDCCTANQVSMVCLHIPGSFCTVRHTRPNGTAFLWCLKCDIHTPASGPGHCFLLRGMFCCQIFPDHFLLFTQFSAQMSPPQNDIPAHLPVIFFYNPVFHPLHRTCQPLTSPFLPAVCSFAPLTLSASEGRDAHCVIMAASHMPWPPVCLAHSGPSIDRHIWPEQMTA